ncbi:MAG: hypothetical protein KC505_02380 [Myxococcales bacterium]|nr:hypothetical protein [Myxococcales bacterium]USN51764.1 MAG: hypothetical protein H6731_04980 [Myxococcales bacterium]
MCKKIIFLFLLCANFLSAFEVQEIPEENIQNAEENFFIMLDKEVHEIRPEEFFRCLFSYSEKLSVINEEINSFVLLDLIANTIKEKQKTQKIFSLYEQWKENFTRDEQSQQFWFEYIFLSLNAKLDNEALLKSAAENLEQLDPNKVGNLYYINILYLFYSNSREYNNKAKDFLRNISIEDVFTKNGMARIVSQIITMQNRLDYSREFLDMVFAQLPSFAEKNPRQSFEIVTAFLISPHYQLGVKEFIKTSMPQQEIDGVKPVVFCIKNWLRLKNTKEAAWELFNELIMQNPKATFQEKYNLIFDLFHTNQAYGQQTLGSLWDSATRQERSEILLYLINYRENGGIKEFLSSTIEDYLSDIYLFITTKSRWNQMLNLVDYLLRSQRADFSSHALRYYKDSNLIPFEIKARILYAILNEANNEPLLEQLRLNAIDIAREVYEIFSLANLEIKQELFAQFGASIFCIDKKNENFLMMKNYLLTQAKDEKNLVFMRRDLVKALKSSADNEQVFFSVWGEQLFWETMIWQEKWNIHPNDDVKYHPHTPRTLFRAKFILGKLTQSLRELKNEDGFFEQEGVLNKARELLMDPAFKNNFSQEIGAEEFDRYHSEALANLKEKLSNVHFWMLPCSEFEGYHNGEVVSYVIRFIAQQKDSDSFAALLSSLMQSLASTEAMTMCNEGAISALLVATFDNYFEREGGDQVRLYEDHLDTIIAQARKLKSEAISFAGAYFKGDENKLMAEILEDSNLADYLKENFLIDKVSGKNHHDKTLAEIFLLEQNQDLEKIIEKYRNNKEPLSELEEIVMDKFNRLIFRPIFLRWLGEKYQDLVIFDPDYKGLKKLSFPCFIKAVEDL